MGFGAVAAAVGSILAPSFLDYAATKNLQSDEWDRQKEMFNMTNEYNSPKNVVARLKDAGLNPNLATGQLTGGLATQSPVPTGTRNISSSNSNVFERLLQKKQADIVEKEGDLLDEQVKTQKYATARESWAAAAEKENADVQHSKYLLNMQNLERGTYANHIAAHDARIILNSKSTSDTSQVDRDYKNNYPRLYQWQPLINAGSKVMSGVAQNVGAGALLKRAW